MSKITIFSVSAIDADICDSFQPHRVPALLAAAVKFPSSNKVFGTWAELFLHFE
jgi:hypothetical protein